MQHQRQRGSGGGRGGREKVNARQTCIVQSNAANFNKTMWGGACVVRMWKCRAITRAPGSMSYWRLAFSQA